MDAQAQELRVKLILKVADTFDTIQKHVQDNREKTLAEAMKYVWEFEKDAAAIIARMKEVKYKAGWRAETELEEIIKLEDGKPVAELQSELAKFGNSH